MDMQMQSDSIAELAKALAAAQGELEPAQKNASNPFLKNKYADLASCISACREVLPKHGLAYAQCIVPSEPGTVCVETLLMHESGQWIKGRCLLPCTVPSNRDGKASMNAAQAVGSAITYARRYGLSTLVGLATEDDDGCASGASPREQRKQEREAHKIVQQQAKDANPAPLAENQRKAMFARLREIGCSKSEEYLAEVSAILGRNIQTSNELTTDDFAIIMRATEPPAPVDDIPFGDFEEAANA